MGSKYIKAGFVAVVLGGCGHATVWSQDQGGGVVALHGSEGSAMDDAHELMAAHCGAGRYEILRRDTVVVGEQAVTNHSRTTDRRHSSSSSVTSVHDVTETRITYHCK